MSPTGTDDDFGADEELATIVDPGLAGFDTIPSRVEASDEERLGRYRLLYQLGRGGMATVYLGRAQGPGGFERPVAIKRIHPELAQERSFVEMFLDEARIASRISHPNVCTVFDFGEAEGTYFLAMEYLVGETLASLMELLVRRPAIHHTQQWHAFAARLVRDACEGLHAAHELRDERDRPLHVVHRDVSLGNLFVTYDGALKVVDFGVAFARDRVHHTAAGTVKGKLAYMAPEQLEGHPADRRYDVWALGVCLWELLAGQRLFRRPTEAEALRAVRSDPIPAPSDVVPRVDPRLDAIVARALSRDPGARYATAREMGHDLSSYLADCGERTSLADLAEWMQRVFSESHTEKLDLLEALRRDAERSPGVHERGTRVDRPSPSSDARDTDPPPDDGSLDGSETLSLPGGQSAEEPPTVPLMRDERAAAPTPPREPSPPPMPPWVPFAAAAAAFVVVAVVAVALVLLATVL